MKRRNFFKSLVFESEETYKLAQFIVDSINVRSMGKSERIGQKTVLNVTGH